MELHEFSWDATGETEGQQIDLRITRQPSGSYKMQSLKNPDQTCECDSPDQAVSAFEDLVQRSTQA
jgi:hypothetical protein